MIAWCLWFVGMVFVFRVCMREVDTPRWALMVTCAFWPLVIVIAWTLEACDWLRERAA